MPNNNNEKNHISVLAITSKKQNNNTGKKTPTPTKSADKTSAHTQSFHLQVKVLL
jgi:hypothetical protein